MIVGILTEQIAAVCPIHGVSIGRRADKNTWRIDFKDEATAAQRRAAAAALAAFDVRNAELQAAERTAKETMRKQVMAEMVDAEIARRG